MTEATTTLTRAAFVFRSVSSLQTPAKDLNKLSI